MRIVWRTKKQPRHCYMVKRKWVEGERFNYQKETGRIENWGIGMFLKRVLWGSEFPG